MSVVCYRYVALRLNVKLDNKMFMSRLSAEASDRLLEKQMEAYSELIDTTGDKGGNAN